MIEDPRLTRKILKYFARDSVPVPANITVDHLAEEFTRFSHQKINDHVSLAKENELLKLGIGRSEEGRTIKMWIQIDGITNKGRDYLKDAQSEYWKSVRSRIAKGLIALLTTVIAGLLIAYFSRFLPASSPQPVQEQSSIPLDSPTPE